MTIYKGSRYQKVPVYKNLVENGPNAGRLLPTLRRRLNPEVSLRDSAVYLFKQGDRLDLLAKKYYGDPQMWWAILDANPEYMTPWDIPVGVLLVIPTLNAVKNGGA